MRGKKAADANADVETRIGQIDQMTLEELAAFRAGVMTEIMKGNITSRKARTIDRAVGNRLKVIEQVLRSP